MKSIVRFVILLAIASYLWPTAAKAVFLVSLALVSEALKLAAQMIDQFIEVIL